MKTLRNLFVFLFIFSSLLPVTGQDRVLTLEEALIGPYTSFRIQNLPQLQWRPGGHHLTMVKKDSLLSEDPITGKKTVLFTLDGLNRIMVKTMGDTLTAIPSMQWKDPQTLYFNLDTILVGIDVQKMKVILRLPVSSRAGNRDFCPDNQTVAFTLGQNLYLVDPDGRVKQLSHDSLPGFVNGQSVSRNEFGITKGTFWSPHGNYLAWYRKDETRVSDYPLVDIRSRVSRLKNIKYPMAGMSSQEIHVTIYDRSKDTVMEVHTPGPYDQYLTNIAWSPDEKYLFIAVLNREQNHLWLNRYDVRTGEKVNTLFEEKNDRYVEPLKPVRFLPAHPAQFIWESRRDGYNHVFLYNVNGKFVQNLTPGKFDVTDVLGFGDHDRYFYYISTEESPIQRHIYRYDLKTGKKLKLTKAHGMHSGVLSPDGKYLLDRYSNIQTPRDVQVLDTKGKRVSTLLTAEDPWEQRRLGRVEMSYLPATRKSPVLYYRLIKPVDFDPSKKYPVVVYVYGGPHSQLVTDSWLGQSRMWQHYMAGQGYVSFTLDNRGTLGRGFDFESCIHRHLGDYEVQDQMRGVAYLKTLPFVDTNRIGVHGWSYGGFMTISMMLKNPGVFKAAVAGGPVTDWKYYEVMYGERYMDRPEENPKGYAQADLKNYVGNLDGHLLIIHGAMDSTVVWQHSLTLLRAFISHGKQVDYFVYPTHPHNVRGYDRIHLMRKVSDYFNQYLKDPIKSPR